MRELGSLTRHQAGSAVGVAPLNHGQRRPGAAIGAIAGGRRRVAQT